MIKGLTILLFAALAAAWAQEADGVPDLLKEINSRPSLGLDDFTRMAAASNPTLRQAQALVNMSAAQARQAGLLPNPSAGYQGEEIRGGSYRGGKEGAFVQQTFVLGGKLGLRRSVFEQQRREDEIGQTAQQYRVTSDVSQSFYSALASQDLVGVNRKLLELATDALTTAHQLANVGQADAPDVLQAEVEAEQAKIDLVTAERSYMQAFRSLSALAGQPDLPLAPLKGDLQHPPALDAQDLAKKIVAQSPEVKHAQQDVQRARAEVRSAKREPVPDLQIHAGLQNNFEPLRETAALAVGVHAFVTAGVNLPIFNRNQGNIAAAIAAVTRAEAEVNRTRLSLYRQTEPLVQNFLADQMQAERYRSEMIPRAERAYRLYMEKYSQMAAAYPQVIVSQRTLFRLQANYIHVLEDLWRNTVLLQNYALTSGLDMQQATGMYRTDSNLPNASGSGAQ